MIAAIIGIYWAVKPPYTHIAAIAVIVATAIGFLDALKTTKEKEYAEEMLRHLARSLPPNMYWKDTVRRLITQLGRSKGYALQKNYFTGSSFDDPEAKTIFLFGSTNADDSRLKGVLVLTPGDYVELASLGKSRVKERLKELMFGQWEKELVKDDKESEEFGSRFAEAAAALYSLPRLGTGFKISLSSPADGKSLEARIGEVNLSFDKAKLDELVMDSPLVRTLKVARMIEKTDPALSKFLNLST
jgi:hypothetical protein